MTIEDRLRRALHQRASEVQPRPDALDQIKEKLMDAQRSDHRNRLLLWLGAAAAVVAVVVGVVVATRDDDTTVELADDTTTTTEEEDTTTTTSETTTTTELAPTADPALAVFPDVMTSQRFDDPVALAFTFARDVLGFREPIVGELQQGDARSGEVEVRAFAEGNPTIVLVRQLEDDTWFVIGTSVETIRLDVPEAGATITSPQTLEGAALAFEGTVDVRLYAGDLTEPIATTFVTGRGDGVLGDFSGSIEFEVPAGVEHGVLVLSESSAEDGSTIAATVIRVHFQ